MRIRSVLLIAIAAFGAAAAGACRAKPAVKPAPAPVVAPGGTLVVLLPDEEAGTAGAVVVTNSSGKVELSAPYDSTLVGAAGPSQATKMDEADVQRTFGSVVSNLPPAPQRFNLYFETDSSELTKESRALLPAVLKAAAARVAPDVTVIGHTDTTGSAANNFRLGLKRAVTVRGLLVSTGVDPSLIQVESHGEADLLTPTADNTAEPRNRRVEITVK
jgi:outer membrane protein OmpA-like peptidoglycan-associated protein